MTRSTNSLVVLLSGSIPQSKRHRHAIHDHLRAVVVEDGRDILAGKSVGSV